MPHDEEENEALCQSCQRTAWQDEQTHFCNTCISEWEEAIADMDCMDIFGGF